MNKFFYAVLVLLLCSCTKYTPKISNTPPKKAETTIELSSIYSNLSASSFILTDKWEITGNQLDTVISNDSSKSVLTIKNSSLTANDGSGIGINYFRVNSLSNNVPYTIASRNLVLDSNKVYSIITAQKYIIPNTLKDFIMKFEETDFTAPPAGFAKLRFIIAAPTLGKAEMNKQNNEMKPLVELTGPQQTINLAAQGRYTLDVLDNSTLLDFVTVPAGNYTQKGVIPSMPGSSFNLVSGNKYTILVTRMTRTQYPENDELKLIQHSF